MLTPAVNCCRTARHRHSHVVTFTRRFSHKSLIGKGLPAQHAFGCVGIPLAVLARRERNIGAYDVSHRSDAVELGKGR